MIFNIEKETDLSFDFDISKTFEDTVKAVLDLFDCEYDCEVSLLILNNDAIKEINYEIRNIDSVTDVLSFPNIVFDNPGNFNSIDDTMDYFEPDSGELILGDIVISAEKVKSQAEEYGHSQLREFAFLICHSMLHLIGFDHINKGERSVMEEKQKEIMNILGILR